MADSTVRKMELGFHNLNSILYLSIPKDSEILHIGLQDERMMMWYRCDPDKPSEQVGLMCCGTGNWAPPQDEAKHIASVVVDMYHLVYHYFLEVPK